MSMFDREAAQDAGSIPATSTAIQQTPALPHHGNIRTFLPRGSQGSNQNHVFQSNL